MSAVPRLALPPSTVKPDLTVEASRRAPRTVETGDYIGFLKRAIAAAGRRVAGDIDELPTLQTLAQALDEAVAHAVCHLRARYSWGDIALRLGVSRQAAQQRWGGAA